MILVVRCCAAKIIKLSVYGLQQLDKPGSKYVCTVEYVHSTLSESWVEVNYVCSVEDAEDIYVHTSETKQEFCI